MTEGESRFISVNAKCPGSAHDSVVFRSSAFCRHLQQNVNQLEDGVLIGDSGYARMKFLMTPYRHADTLAKERYNRAHCRTRVAVEMTFGSWKRRFGILHGEETFYLGKDPVLGRIVKQFTDINVEKNVHVQCFPLYSVLLALNKLHVDYFSLDVKGAERAVLETIPWNNVDITIVSIEYIRWPGGMKHLKTYMSRKGYDFMKQIEHKTAPDLIFMKKTNIS